MAKSMNTAVLDALLNEIKNNCNLMTVCSAEPTSRTEAVTTYALADVAMASGDFTLSGASNRAAAVAAKSGVTVDTGGTATHIALTSASILQAVTTCNSQALVGGATVDIPTWNITVNQPT